MASEKVTKLIEEVKGLTVLELRDLVKSLEEEFGVTAAAPMAMAAMPAAGATAAAAAVAEEKTEFTLILKDVGADKLKVIKVVKDSTGLGLKEAKELVDTAPKPVKENVSKEEATALEEKLKEVGATCEIV